MKRKTGTIAAPPGNGARTVRTSTTTTDANKRVRGSTTGGRRAGSAQAQPVRDETRLPHACGRCGARWGGHNTAHCSAQGCCRTFSGITTFERHHRNGECLNPASLGMSLLSSRPYPCWGYPGEIEGADW